jgi:hypothetical protein
LLLTTPLAHSVLSCYLIVTWWERNQPSNKPVARMSSDRGEMFSPLLILAANGTITSTEEEGVGEEEEDGENGGGEEGSAEGVIEEEAEGPEVAE